MELFLKIVQKEVKGPKEIIPFLKEYKLSVFQFEI